MRPVDTRSIRHFSTANRGVARRSLADLIGWYCSYCEMRIDNRPEREHVEATSKGGDAEALSNNLLACTNCNSTKNDRISSRDQCIWPDRDNTFRAYTYEMGGVVAVNPDLDADILAKARFLYIACGLDKIPSTNQESVDNRWNARTTAWTKALDAKKDWQEVYKPEQDIETRNRNAKATVQRADSFFSVWMTVFHDEPEIKRELINYFKGTAKECFDENGNAVKRPGGIV